MALRARRDHCLGQLRALVERLPQALQHMDWSIQAAEDAGHVGADRGTEYAGMPGAAIAAARLELADATQAVEVLYRALSDTHNMLTRIHYAGPDLEGE